MACISCENWKHDGQRSMNDLLLGHCSVKGTKTTHDENCSEYKEKESKKSE